MFISWDLNIFQNWILVLWIWFWISIKQVRRYRVPSSNVAKSFICFKQRRNFLSINFYIFSFFVHWFATLQKSHLDKMASTNVILELFSNCKISFCKLFPSFWLWNKFKIIVNPLQPTCLIWTNSFSLTQINITTLGFLQLFLVPKNLTSS